MKVMFNNLILLMVSFLIFKKIALYLFDCENTYIDLCGGKCVGIKVIKKLERFKNREKCNIFL